MEVAMKIYIVSSGCVHEGGTNRHVALTEARAIELAEDVIDLLNDDVPDGYDINLTWPRLDADYRPQMACEIGRRPARRVALWRQGNDFVAVHEWEVTT
jgi:hypothetical protein